MPLNLGYSVLALMPLLLDKSPDPKKAEKTMGSSTKLLLPVSLFFTCLLLVIVASFQNSSKTDEEKAGEWPDLWRLISNVITDRDYSTL